MPLDQAVYVPTVGARAAFIAGVRGGYVFNFDPATGSKVSSTRLALSGVRIPSFGDSSIAYDSVGDKLYVSHWNDPPVGFAAFASGCKVYQVNPSTFATTGVNLSVGDFGFIPSSFNGYYIGPHQIIASGGIIYGMFWESSGNTGGKMFRWDPSTSALVYPGGYGGGDYNTQSWQGLVVNGSEIWTSQSDNNFVYFVDPITLNSTSLATATRLVDVCVNSSGQAYFTTKGATIRRVSPAKAFLADITLPGSNHYVLRIRYNPVGGTVGLVYAPDMQNNCIYVIDPATDTVIATKTGFDSPLDCVFTPTKSFAVQLGAVGLKEIT